METDSIQLSSSNSNLDSFVFQSESDLASFSIIILLLLLLITFFRSAAKAYIIESESINQNGKNKDGIGERVSKNLQNSERILTAITAFNFILNTVLILLLSAYIHQIFFELFSFTFEIILLIGLLFILLFVIGELIPEYLATSSPSLISRITAYPVFWVDWIFRPFSSLYIRFTTFLIEKNPDIRKPISIDEITQVLHMNSDTESADEKEILEEIVKFGNKNVSDIMKPRTEVVSLDIKTSFPEVLGLFIESGFSRIPVYSGSLDNIRGILYVKDILPHSKKEDSFSWQSVIRPPFFVPETKKINALLQEFQKNKVHLAMVIDEYGGTSGIVTLEDIIEEIVGEIVDEFDEEDNFFSKIDENTFLFDGKTLIGDFLKIVKCDEAVFDEVGGEFETLAGLILELKGDIPQLQDKIKYAQFTFTIEAADKKRILKVKTEIETD